MPEASGKILDQLAQPADGRTFLALRAGQELKPGTELPEPHGVFPRHVEAEGEGATP